MNPDNYISLFCVHCVVGTMANALSSNALMSQSKTFIQWAREGQVPNVARSMVSPLLCVLSSLQNLHPTDCVVDAQSLESFTKLIEQQFIVIDDFPCINREECTEILEYALTKAQQEGLEALAEASAGFPVSGGDICKWNAHRLNRFSAD